MDGTPFGRYRLIELIGRGGMGEVWRAYDTAANNRVVAIKLLPSILASDSAFVQRFRREADAAARLNNPHIIPIHNYGEIDGRLYVDMRLVEGRDLQEVLAPGPLEPARAVRIIEQVAKALQAAHKIGLVHRDVKPSNILLDEDDFAYLIDFGIARVLEDTRLTSTGAMIGSWHYMAPERLQAREADARADIYALACVLYECLTGHRPFPGDSLESQVGAHLHTPPPKPSVTQPDVPAQIDPVIAKGMAKDPDHRYSTTVELADAARGAVTVPIRQPAPSPAPDAPTQYAATPISAPPTKHNRPPQPPPSAFASAASPHRPETLSAYAGQRHPQTETRGLEKRQSPSVQRDTKIHNGILIGIAVIAFILIAIGLSLFSVYHPASFDERPFAIPGVICIGVAAALIIAIAVVLRRRKRPVASFVTIAVLGLIALVVGSFVVGGALPLLFGIILFLIGLVGAVISGAKSRSGAPRRSIR